MKKYRWLSLILFLIGLLVACGLNSQQTLISPKPITLTISAAANLNLVAPEIGKLWEQETGNKVTFNFGATTKLAQQIEQGAIVDLFAAANKKAIENLDQKGLIISDTKKIYAIGAIAIAGHHNLSSPTGTAGFQTAILLKPPQCSLHGVLGNIEFACQHPHTGKQAAPMTGTKTFAQVAHGLLNQRNGKKRAHRGNCPVFPDSFQEECSSPQQSLAQSPNFVIRGKWFPRSPSVGWHERS